MNKLRYLPMILLLSAISFAQDEPIRVESNLVTVNVSVTDQKGAAVRGLTRDDFTLLDEGRRQAIDIFSSGDGPLSIGIIYDLHPTTDEQMSNVLAALRQFTGGLGDRDQFFVNVIGDNGDLVTGFVPNDEQVRDFVIKGDKKHGMSLYDAIIAGTGRVNELRNAKRMLIVLSDGADHSSDHSLKQLRDHLRGVNLPVYAISFNSRDRTQFTYLDIFRSEPLRGITPGEFDRLDSAALEGISKSSGGTAFETDLKNRAYLAAIFDKVADDMRSQYVLGFSPEKPDGKWHKLAVNVAGPKAKGLKVSSRKGYQSPKQR